MKGWHVLWQSALTVGLGVSLYQLAGLRADLDRVTSAFERAQDAATTSAVTAVQPPAVGVGDRAVADAVAVLDAGAPSTAALTELVRQVVRAEQERKPSHQAPEVDEARILDVVRRDQGEVFERHLEFHADRWQASRGKWLDAFAERLELSDDQRASLDQLVQDETEVMVSLFRQPKFRDHPELLARRWAKTLAATDQEVAQLLDDTQMAAWKKGRAFERKTLFPWLDPPE